MATDYSWIGATDPDSHGRIKRRYHSTKLKLSEFIRSSRVHQGPGDRPQTAGSGG